MDQIKLQLDTNNLTDKAIRINLEQDFDQLQVLSLKLTSNDVYNKVSASHGVLVGRVTLKNGIGVQNAKVSVFIPISNADSNRNDIIQYYPFQTINDTFPNGLRYNLLPRVRNNTNSSHRAVGSFPDITDFSNYNIMEEIYNKYYKLSAVTNDAGDYMIFGIPVGVHQVCMDFDLFDTKSFEITANDLVEQISLNSDLSNLKSFLASNISGNTLNDTSNVEGFTYIGGGNYEVDVNIDVDKMPNIFHETKQVNIQPFWGDDNSNIGISQCDFNVDFKYTPTAVFFGFLGSSPEQIKYLSDGAIDTGSFSTYNFTDDFYGVVGKSKTDSDTGSFYPVQDIEIVVYKMDSNNTFGTKERVGTYKTRSGSGVFKITLPMYYDYYTLNEFGDLVPTNNKKNGVPTKGRYCFEMYETNKVNYGIRRPWGGFDHSVLAGVRIPANDSGDLTFGGWLGTSSGVFEYDIVNNKRKFYTIKTSYRNHGNTVYQLGNKIPYIPRIDPDKNADVFWQFPLNHDKITDDNVVIGSCFLPRVKTPIGGSNQAIYPNFWITNDDLINPNLLRPDDATRPNFGPTQILYGIGADLDFNKGGKNIGPVYEELFGSEDFTTNGLNSYGVLRTINFGDNSDVVYRGTAYSRDLAKSKLSKTNGFNVHEPYTQAVTDQATIGLFVNSVDYRTNVRCMEVDIYDITDEIRDLVNKKVYSSYNKSADHKYNGNYYYFGMWNGANALIDMQNVYFDYERAV